MAWLAQPLSQVLHQRLILHERAWTATLTPLPRSSGSGRPIAASTAGRSQTNENVEALHPNDRPVRRAVELAVSAAVEAVTVGLPGGGGDWRGSARARELRLGAESVGAGDLADQLRGGSAHHSRALRGAAARVGETSCPSSDSSSRMRWCARRSGRTAPLARSRSAAAVPTRPVLAALAADSRPPVVRRDVMTGGDPPGREVLEPRTAPAYRVQPK